MLRRLIASLIFLSILVIGAGNAFSGDDAWKPIKVRYYGNSFFVIESNKGVRICFDPHMITEYGRPPDDLKADVVLISHNHVDHTRVDALANWHDKDDAKKPKIIRGLKGTGLRADWAAVDEKIGGVKIRSVGLYHDDMEGLRSGKVSAFIVEMDGWRICHLGDLGHMLSPAQLKAIGEVDVLMIPVGGIYTINGSEAKKVMAQIKPKQYVFPMHYGTKFFDDLLPVNEFLEGQKKERVAESDDNQLTLNRDPARPRPLTVVFTYPVEAPKKKKQK
jgi:L-ascorbate metabolism protein UlaG (beta-lactamase superfamily)